MFRFLTLLITLVAIPLALHTVGQPAPPPVERHLRNIRQLTFGGQNAEAYFSSDERTIVFQSTRPGVRCDQIFTMNLDGSDVRMVSNGQGRTTCGYFVAGDRQLLYASTHVAGADCPPPPDLTRGYVWAIYPEYDIFRLDLRSKSLARITNTPGYDAEATVSNDGRHIIFTSVRDGDLELYSMTIDGKDVKRLTNQPGYDGGAFYSADGRQIVWRAADPGDAPSLERYRELLARGLVEPRQLEIYVMNADGSNRRQVTKNGKANFAPFFHPDGKRIIFASNIRDPRGRNFDLFLVNTDGSGLEQITFDPTFDGFPMFSRDGRRLLFASNRLGKVEGETNIFLADWVE